MNSLDQKVLWIFFFLFFTAAHNNLHARGRTAMVFVDHLKQQPIETQASYYGRLTPLRLFKVYSPLEALVTEIKAQEGRRVKKGQVLARIKKNIIDMDINPLEIKSPIDGFILDINTVENNLVLKNQPLFSLYDGKTFQTTVHLSPDDANKLKIGDQVSVNVSDNYINGKLNTLSEGIDPHTGTRSAHISIESKKGLRPGQLAKVIFTLEKKEGFLISKKALQKSPDGDYINFLKDSKVKKIKVFSKRRHNDLIEIWGKGVDTKSPYIVKSSINPLMEGKAVKVSKQKR